MRLRNALLGAAICMSIAYMSPMFVLADSMDDYAAYDYMKKEEKEKLEKAGLTNYQIKQIEALCDKLGIDSKQYIEDNYYGLLVGIKQTELEKEYASTLGYEDNTEMVEADGKTWALSHNYRYNYETGEVVDNTMYYTNNDDQADNGLGEINAINQFAYWDMLPAYSWSEGEFFFNPENTPTQTMRVYADGCQEAAAQAAIASGKTSFLLEDRTSDEEIVTTYYVDGDPTFISKTGEDYLNEYGTNGTKYYDLSGNELSTAEFKDSFDNYYSSFGQEYVETVNGEKQRLAKHICEVLKNNGGDASALTEEYKNIIHNLDSVSGGELFEQAVMIDQMQREIKAQRGAVMEEARHYMSEEIDIDPQFVDVEASYADEVQKYVEQYVNEYRASKGVGSVEITSSVLGAFADTRAIEACYLYESKHRRPDESELQFSEIPVLENLACATGNLSAQELARTVVNCWVNSYCHELNLRNETNKSMSIGVAAKMIDGQIVYYVSQDFSAVPASRLDEEYADADTSVITPKTKAAHADDTVYDFEGNEMANESATDESLHYMWQPIVGDVFEINGMVPARIQTNLNGGGAWNVFLFDANSQLIASTTLHTQNGEYPEYTNYPYAYIGFYSISGQTGTIVPVGTNSSAVSGNITNYWSYDDGSSVTGGNWDLCNKYN